MCGTKWHKGASNYNNHLLLNRTFNKTSNMVKRAGLGIIVAKVGGQ